MSDLIYGYGVKIIETHNISDQDRLRRLDALFAERVMGYPSPNMANGAQLPAFTRSLDAVWEGAQMRFDWWVLRKITSRGHPENDLFFIAEVGKRQEKGEYSADHPAEALVLACLRAVGCSEEEMK